MQYLDRLMNQIMTKIQNDDLYKIIVNLGIFILASGKIRHHNIILLVKLRAILFQNSKVQQNSFQNR